MKVLYFTDMGKISARINDEIEHEFRELVSVRVDSDRPLDVSVEEAIVQWIKRNKKILY